MTHHINNGRELKKKFEKKFFKNSSQHGRYIFIIDRSGCHSNSYFNKVNMNKNESEKEYEKDVLYIFQPPIPFGDILSGIIMCESMHLKTLNYLLTPLKNKNEKIPIGCKHLIGGKMFLLSFQMLSIDEIRCYLYLDQKCIKFEYNDMYNIFPYYFVKTDNNNNIKQKQNKINPFPIQLIDNKYKQWIEIFK